MRHPVAPLHAASLGALNLRGADGVVKLDHAGKLIKGKLTADDIEGGVSTGDTEITLLLERTGDLPIPDVVQYLPIFNTVVTDPTGAWNGTDTWTCPLTATYIVSAHVPVSIDFTVMYLKTEVRLTVTVDGTARGKAQWGQAYTIIPHTFYQVLNTSFAINITAGETVTWALYANATDTGMTELDGASASIFRICDCT